MNPVVDIASVVKTYYPRACKGPTPAAVQALDGVSLTIAPGEFFGLLGPNGAGKTTLISLMAGLMRPTAGHIRINGHDVVEQYREARRSVGVVPQELAFDPFLTVRETLRFQSGYFGLRHNDAWIDEILHHVGLSSKADTNMRALSGGMKRRVLVAQALVHRPPVIVLDEPTAGVDVELRQTLWQFITRLNREGHTIVLTTHYLEEAQQLCRRIAMLKAGRVVALANTTQLLDTITQVTLRVRLAAGSAAPVGGRGVAEDTYVFDLAHVREVEPQLENLRRAGAALEDIQVERADLEDVFLDIMGRPHPPSSQPK